MADIYQIKLPGETDPYDVVDKKSKVRLTQAQYDALSTAQKNDPTKIYFIDNASEVCVDINDSVTSADSVWSSYKVDAEITSRINASITSVLQTSF